MVPFKQLPEHQGGQNLPSLVAHSKARVVQKKLTGFWFDKWKYSKGDIQVGQVVGEIEELTDINSWKHSCQSSSISQKPYQTFSLTSYFQFTAQSLPVWGRW